ncbi:hypothetical protein P9228_16960 [Mesorhizobium sp. WSM4898]|uniref:hypothetical protein n=1 Tax=Mesorhizobium sp. WSM4898 TaxID=3038544 RepID=UPI0024153E62|nr:hypothetical protein [Mesorhizobium sp. WSM4898]MDG4908120.1 hypothetical protein [Mesorhizobium sp. WSM4898]
MAKATRAPGGGRKPKGEFAGKSAAFSTRITQELRAALDKESEATGKSISQIVERRLRESYDKPKIQRELADKRIKAMALMTARLATSVESATGKKWNEDRFTCEALMSALATALSRIMPAGEIAVPDLVRERMQSLEARLKKPGALELMLSPEGLGASYGNTLFEMLLAWRAAPPLADEADDIYHLVPFIRQALKVEVEGMES